MARITLTEMSKKRNIKETTLRYWISMGLSAEMHGGIYWIDDDVLDKFMRDHVTTETRYKLNIPKGGAK